MALTLTNSTLSDPADKTEVEANFTDVVNKFNGNIVNADISSSAAIDVSKLSASYERLLVTFKVLNNGSTINGQTAATPDLEDLTASTIPGSGAKLDVVPLPGDTSDTNWEVYDVSWSMLDTGAGDNKVRVEAGYYDSGGWNRTATPVAAFTLSNSAGAGDNNSVHAVNSSSTPVAFSASGPINLALVYDTAGAGSSLSTTGDFLVVSVLLRRVIQAA